MGLRIKVTLLILLGFLTLISSNDINERGVLRTCLPQDQAGSQNTLQIVLHFGEIIEFNLTENINCSEVISRKLSFDHGNCTIDDDDHIMEDGQLFLKDFNFYPEFCISNLFQKASEISEGEVRICKEVDHSSNLIIPKCCSPQEIIAIDGNGDEFCMEGSKEELWSPNFKDDYSHCPLDASKIEYQVQKSNAFDKMLNQNMYGHCYAVADEAINANWKKLKFHLNKEGKLVYKKEQSNMWEVHEGPFCIDNVKHQNSTFEGVIHCPPKENPSPLMDKRHVDNRDRNKWIYFGAFMFGASFLIVTVFIYILIWDTHNIHGWTFFCYAFSLLFLYIFMASAHVYKDKGSGFCKFIGIGAHFFYISTFCWLATICCDLFYTFKYIFQVHIRKLSPTVSKSKARFYSYLGFSWGFPAFVILMGIILDEIFKPSDDMCNESKILTPMYGVFDCYIAPKSRGPYTIYPVGILLGVNVIFFALTVRQLCKYEKSRKDVIKNSPGKDRRNFVIFTKLFILMGVSWFFEIISWSCCLKYSNSKPMKLEWILSLDVVNIVQAIAIFYIFVCQPQVIIRLWNKYPKLRGALKHLKRFDAFKSALANREQSDTTTMSTKRTSGTSGEVRGKVEFSAIVK